MTITNSTTTERYGSFVYVNPANGHQYILSEPDTWLGAQNQAEALGGNLVAINDAAENQWLVDTFGRQNLWIGLTDSEIYGKQEGNFQWVNGESVAYTNWAPGEPNGQNINGVDFAHFWQDSPGGWADTYNEWQPLPGIIEIDPATIAQPIVNLMVTDAIAGEDGNAGQIVIQRLGNLNQDLTINYTVAGDATNGSDYRGLSGHITIPAGKTLVTMPIIALPDSEVEGNETVIVTLESGDYRVGTHGSGHVVLTDNDVLIADSQSDFSGVQGQNNWQYGYYDNSLTSADFKLMTEFNNNIWRVQQGVLWTGLTRNGGHPNVEGVGGAANDTQWAVRRWTSEVDGKINISGNLAKIDTIPESGLENGIIGRILVDGVEVWSQAIGATDGVGVDYSIDLTVSQGSAVDFAIDANGNQLSDTTKFTSTITREIESFISPLDDGFSFESFDAGAASELNILGDAALVAGDTLRLTPSARSQNGTVWHKTKQSVGDGFETTFQFQIHDLVNGGADGLAFVIQNHSDSRIGRLTGAIPNSLAIEFDTFQNSYPNGPDPNDNHISVQTRGTLANSDAPYYSLGYTTDIPNLKDGNPHDVKIKYVPGTLEIFIDDLTIPALTVPVNLETTLRLDDGEAWVGLSAGTGAAWETHDILNWTFSDSVYTHPETGHKYFLTTPDTWLGAQEQAQALGGNLVTIDDAAENQWLFDTFGNGPKWIGLNDSPIYGNTEGDYQWVSGDAVTFLNWRSTPDNTLHTPEGEDFSETNFYGVGTWNDMPSQQNWIRPGIVEITAPPPPIPDNSWLPNLLGTVNSDQSRGVVVDNDGNVYIAGGTNGSLDGNTNASGINANFADPFLTKYDALGNKLWTRQPGSTGFDYYNGIANDASGNIYTVGYDDGPGQNGSGDITLTKWDSDGNQLWRQLIGTAAHEWASGVTVDSAGHVYIAGYSQSWSTGSPADALLAKYDSDGNLIWQQTIGSAGEDMARSVVTDAAGNVYVAGVTTGSLDGNTNAGSTDIFLTKFNAAGVKLWTEQLGTPAADGYVYIRNVGGEYRRNVQVALDKDGNIYLSGTTEGSLNGNTNAGGKDAFLVKYDRNGTQLWTEQLGTAGDDRAWGVTVDKNGIVYLTGTTQGSLNGQTYFGSNDTFVMTLDSDGNQLTTRIIATANDDMVQDIKVDRSGNIYTTGNTTGSLANTNAGNYDVWVSKNTFVNMGPIISDEPTNLIQNGDFEAVDVSGFWAYLWPNTVPAGFNWSVANGYAELINQIWKGVSGTSNPDGFDQTISLDDATKISQNFATEVGKTYELSFWYAHDPNSAASTGYIDVTGNNSLLSTTLTHDIPATRDNMQFVKYTATFIADSNSTTLSFQGDAANSVKGFVIDDVRVAPVTELNYEDFSSLAGLNLIGSTVQLGDTLRLTPKNRTSGSQIGAVWHATPQSVEDGFETTFQFQINDLGGSGGDGFAFLIQNSSATAIGSGGGHLGYSGIYNSLAVEFDTFDNNEPGTLDPSDNHLSVHTGGTRRNSVGIAPLGVTSDIPNMSDGEVHTVTVKYIPGTMQIFMDDLSTPVLTVPVDLGNTLNLDNGKAWVGFTAAASAAWENHDILNWTFSNPPIPQNNPPTLTTPNLTLTGATENAGFTVNHADLLAATGATDVDGDPLTFRIQTFGSDIPTKNGQPVTAGVTTLSAGEAIVWTPTTVGNAQPAFTATLTDGKVTVATPVTVSVDVNPVIVTIDATDPDATEGSDPGQFTFTRTGDTTNPMTVNFTIEPSIHWSRPQARNGTDYATIPTSITIPAGESSVTVTITSLEDTETEWPETVRLKVAEGDGYEINSSENLDTVVIWDNETPQLRLYAEWYTGQPTNFHRESYASESGNQEGFLLRRIGSVAEDLTVYYSLPGTATNGEDYKELPGSITIPAGQHDVYLSFIPIDDSEVEGDETVEVTLTPDPTYTFVNLHGRIWDRIPLTLVDNDDKPTVEISVSDNRASEYGDPGQFTITRTGDTSNPLTVDYWICPEWWDKAKNGIDYQQIPESITIPAGASSATIDIIPIDDSELEKDEIVDIYLKSSPNYAMSGAYYAQLKILDNETQRVQSRQQFGTSADDVANSVAVDSAGNVYTVGSTTGNFGGTNSGGSDVFIAKRNSSGSQLWQMQLGTADNDGAKQIALDSANNLYILGWSGNSSNSWIAKYDSNGTQQWQKPLGNAGYDIANSALTIGNDGSLYVTGGTTGNINGTNQGATDAWVAKYDSDGNQTWVKQFGTADEDEALGIAVDNTGKVYITGNTKGSLAGTREGDGDAWVTQLDSSGNLQWQTQLGTTAVDIARSVAVDNNGRVYIGGQTFGWLGETYAGSANHWIGDNAAWWAGIHGDKSGLGGTYYGNGDAWVAQLNSTTGAVNWKRLLGTTNADSATKVVADSLGNVYLAGRTQGKLATSQFGADDIFLAQYNIDGALQWKQQLGTAATDIVNDMVLTSSGIYLAGDTTGNLQNTNKGGKDAWVIHLA
ncbi:SBBP repeat-containing protein [[Phormidium] sp. ETS-05]|uniref:SBBP repeat-containing protein n=1 Tax=[Phormidium] sp. ETS-05 TaxID=222819 RepID=UPI0018EF1BE4|nr:SBBP repeat-containing protein [[Phormidium] sp. ETS-05]